MARIAAAEREALSGTRRAQILEAALRVWMRRGFDGSPVEAIAREAGLAKGTLYLYFPTKDAILDAIVERYSLLPDMTELTEALRSTPPEQAIPLIAGRLYERLRERAPLVGLMLREFSLRPRDARVFFERVMLPVNRLFAAYLDGFVARGVLRPLDTFVAARALVGMLMVFVLSQHVFGGEEIRPIPDATIVDTVQELFLRGVLAPTGATPAANLAPSMEHPRA
jgi:AcrR family transcriptional regulator